MQSREPGKEAQSFCSFTWPYPGFWCIEAKHPCATLHLLQQLAALDQQEEQAQAHRPPGHFKAAASHSLKEHSMRVFFTNYYLRCVDCGHRCRPHKSPRESIRLMLTGRAGHCRNCGRKLNPDLSASTAPLVLAVRKELEAAGVTPVC
jgi:hypothetical protein